MSIWPSDLRTSSQPGGRADIFALNAERGLAAGGPEEPSILLTVEDVARIAASVVVDILS